jgi:ABC-type sugar transport system ATPase subunit
MIAVRELSFTVEAGKILALLGPNGAGKTSTILAIVGHVQIKAGTLSIDGRDITRLSALSRTDLGLALVPEGRRLFSDLTVAENLTVGGYSRSRADEKRNLARVFELFPRLAERRVGPKLHRHGMQCGGCAPSPSFPPTVSLADCPSRVRLRLRSACEGREAPFRPAGREEPLRAMRTEDRLPRWAAGSRRKRRAVWFHATPPQSSARCRDGSGRSL